MLSAAAPEGSNKLARVLFGVAVLAAPACAAVFFSAHPILAALVAEAFVLGTAFVAKVWDKLESQWVDAVAKWASPKVESLVTRYAARYRRAIYFQHRSFDVKGLNTQGAFSLELNHVFVELSLSPEAPHKISADPLRKPSPDNAMGARREIWDLLKDERCRHLAILGPPGSGKTTLLKHVALALAGPRRTRPLSKTPVLLLLRDLAADICSTPKLTLADAFRKFPPGGVTAPADWIENQLASGNCVVLLDGLDEVADAASRLKVASWVEQRLKDHGENLFVISSRPHGYLANPIEGVTVLDVRPFAWPQVISFVNNWYLATETVRKGHRDRGVEMEAKAGADDLLRRLSAAPALTDLAVNPLLLTMITTVHKERNSLPGRRVELYNEICDVFLGKRQASKGIVLDLTPAQKRRVLEPLAWYLMCVKKRGISTAETHAQIAPVLALVSASTTPDSFLHDVRDGSGLLIEKESGEYAFAHLTFQEYLAATHARSQRLEGELAAQVSDPWWAEAIRLYAAQANATALVEACLAIEPPSADALVLAVDCLDEGLEIDPATRSRAQEVAVAGLDHPDPWRRSVAASVLWTRYVNSMVRIDEHTYVSNDLIPNAVYEMFAEEFLEPQEGFPLGDGKKPATGISSSLVTEFCARLNERQEGWTYFLPDFPSGGTDSTSACHWTQDATCKLKVANPPLDWSSRVLESLRERRPLGVGPFLTSSLGLDYVMVLAHSLRRDGKMLRTTNGIHTFPLVPLSHSPEALGAFAEDLNPNPELQRAMGRDFQVVPALDRALTRLLQAISEDSLSDTRALAQKFASSNQALINRGLEKALQLGLESTRDVQISQVFALDVGISRRLAAGLDLHRAPADPREVEILSLILLGMVRAGTPSANLFSALSVAARVVLEQQAGRLSQCPVGILLCRIRRDVAGVPCADRRR